MSRRSPSEVRGEQEQDSLDTYQPPRTLQRQSKVDSEESDVNNHQKPRVQPPKSWLSKLNISPASRNKSAAANKKTARFSSLESSQSSSSIEIDPSNSLLFKVPSISIANEQTDDHIDTTAGRLQMIPAPPNETRRRQEIYRDYYGRSRHGAGKSDREIDDEDDDAFDDSPLPMPYSSSSMARSTVVRQQTDAGIVYPNSSAAAAAAAAMSSTVGADQNIVELLDDRQGMNSSEQPLTKAEQANRASLDGSIMSDKPASTFKDSTRRDKQKRAKSPSSFRGKRTSRHSRRGLLGLASHLKLTKKHDSIAALQLSILNSRFISLKTLDKDLQSFLPKGRLNMKQFEDRIKLMHKFKVLATIEYRFASKYETYVCKHALQESNQAKNNYKRCIPYDYNRVVLRTLTNVPDSDYINASHVDSCLKPNAYIAAQGPNENTVNDFWRMIWEQKTFVIVMLTKVFDFIRVMCDQYWPVAPNKPERYGNLEVTLLYEEPLADFVIRTIKLTKIKENSSVEKQDNPSDERPDTKVATEPTGAFKLDGDSDNEYSDNTSVSEEIILNEEAFSEQPPGEPTVRLPKFVAARGPSRRRRRRSSSVDRTNKPNDAELAEHRRRASSVNAAERQQVPPTVAKRPNEFLHPLFNVSTATGATSDASGSTALSPVGSEPNTPMTPRTPSSAGLDRSSATRKAVKKKRRERVKEQRPRRTQFLAPSESQLKDDEEMFSDNEPAGDGKESAKNERIVYQFHYNSWASHTCPFISSLLHFRRRVRICMDEMSKSGKTGPTVVHCNDGCGRTGAYLCIDANLELAEEDNVIDVYNYTRKMRQSRKFLIENLEQYKFVYDTIEESLFCGKTWFPVAELHKSLKHKSQRNILTKKNEYQREYEKICRMASKFSIGDCAGGHRVENREKNRDVSTVPPDNFRPYLTSFQTNDSTDYINAVFVDGYTRSKEYIVTEWPLHRTISDFWSLVYDHDCNSVILLANPTESSTYPSFLPGEKELRRKFGPVFSAEMVSYTHYQNIKSWMYTINKKIVSLTEVIAGVKSEAKTTQVFQITCWPQGHRVPTSTNTLVELMNMVERWRQRTTYGPVCVVSLDGKSRAGVYCAANVAIEQVVQHNEVDVFQAVKTVRRHRPQLIENMTEYKYCYDLILHYVLHYVNSQNAPNG